jgi:CheY-like chemotaxis protein
MAKMLQRIIGEDIVLEIRTGGATRHVKADRGQIEQVLLNLFVNARDAMPDGGRLIVETADVTLDDGHVRTHEGVVPGPYVVLSVSDTGAGMTREVQDRAFEPFFTTKEAGKGTGLGLATVYGIVKQHDGHVAVYSEPGRGTTMRVYLPASTEARGEDTAGARRETRRGTETILVVEDDPGIRYLVTAVLAPLGYEVLAAASGEEALAMSGQRPGAIDLLLSDVIMPGMNGRELANRLRESRPVIGVVFMSGYTHDVIDHHGVLDPGFVLLQKPFTPALLLEKIGEVLDGPAGRP